MNDNHRTTMSGTNIDEVKRSNAQSGLSYNEAKIELAKKKGYIEGDQTKDNQ